MYEYTWVCMSFIWTLNSTAGDTQIVIGVRAVQKSWIINSANFSRFGLNVTNTPIVSSEPNPSFTRRQYNGKSILYIISEILFVFIKLRHKVKLTIHISFAAYLLVNYNILTFTTSCNFYDPNLDDFSSSGCSVGMCSNPVATQCICNHLTSFSSSFNLPTLQSHVNPLDAAIGTAAFSLTSLNQNPLALAFCIGCLCVYLIILIIALRYDQYDRFWVFSHVLKFLLIMLYDSVN